MEDYSQVYELWVANVFQSDRQVIFSSRIQNGDHSKDYKLVMLVDQKRPCAGLIASLVKLRESLSEQKIILYLNQ